ncbi:recombination regulator RecX [Nocardia sp. NPDC051750]|uniref:recombination regulator RecX n=1 Tax=Nocardia sp. NPDC051750 TaxID=3364325 RepID=UPI00379447CE
MSAGGRSTGSGREPRSDESDPQRTRPTGPSETGQRSGAGGSADRSPGGSVEQAKEACLRLLAVRARSRAELGQRLSAKGFATEVTEQVLDRLAEVGLVDDAEFARQWVQQRHRFSGKGRQALAQELRRKGVAREAAAAALEDVTADDETERATELVRRKLRTLPAGLDREKAIRRLVGMLARRGYGHSVAYAVVKAEWEASDAGTRIEDPGVSLD